jgi:RNA polymerase sigma factor (sigma-70 family)
MYFNLYETIKKAKNNDTKSIEELINYFNPLLKKYASKHSEFEDTYSELILHFIETINKIPLDKKIKEEKYILAYIKKSIHNKYLKLINSNNLTFKLTNNDAYYNDESNLIFYDLISSLSKKEQTILTKKFVYNLKNIEISNQLNISPQNIQMCIKRALKKIEKIC